MYTYGVLGTSIEINCPEHAAEPNYIKMREPRPSPQHIARDDGSWGVDFSEQAKALRGSLISSNIKVFDVYWQVDDASIQFMQRAVDTYDYMVKVEQEKPEEERKLVYDNTVWILADNTLRVTNYKEIRCILKQYSKRIEEIFRQYNIWRAGDRDTPFTFYDENA